MPKEIEEYKTFLSYVKGTKAGKNEKPVKKTVYIKKNKKNIKFKIRRGRHLYTYTENKPELAKRITDSLDSNNVEKVEIRKRRVVRKAKK